MYDREREKELWKQSGARYRVKDGEMCRMQVGERRWRKADNFEADAAPKSGKKLPLHLAALENEYGNVEFVRQEDGSLMVSFARRQEFQEPVFMQDSERIHMNHSTESRVGGMTRMQNSGAVCGAEAFVLNPKKSAGRQMNQILQLSFKPLEQIVRSMASLLVPVGQTVMAQEQQERICQDLVRTARRVFERSGEQKEDEDRKTKEQLWTYWTVRKADEAESGEKDGEENSENGEAKNSI